MINYVELVINNPEYFKQFTCNDLLFLNYDCPTKVKKAAKWSEHNYIYYVLSGKKTLHTPAESLTLTRGSIAFIKKGACIVEQFFDDPFCVLVFMMPDSFIHSFLKSYSPGTKPTYESSAPIIPIHGDKLLHMFYQSIVPYFTAEEAVPVELIELKFKELLVHLLRNPANAVLHNYFLTIKHQHATSISEIMENNFSYNLTLEAYAKMTNRSISSFKRDFQSIYKTTPGKWVIQKKIEHAQKLLLQTKDSVASISFDCGFENSTHFSRIFRQKTGFTPIEYRKRAEMLQLS